MNLLKAVFLALLKSLLDSGGDIEAVFPAVDNGGDFGGCLSGTFAVDSDEETQDRRFELIQPQNCLLSRFVYLRSAGLL